MGADVTRVVRAAVGVGRIAGKVTAGVANGAVVATSWGVRRATGIDRHVARTRALNAEVAELIEDLETTVRIQDAKIARLSAEVQRLRATSAPPATSTQTTP